MSRVHQMELSCEQTMRRRGVCEANQRVNLAAFKPDLGNSAVRHYRGASENVAMAEL